MGFGPLIFIALNNYFGYDPDCNDPCNKPDTCGTDEENTAAAGNALVFTSSVPWVICGMLYTSLHWVYPRDMERIFRERALEAEQAGTQSWSTRESKALFSQSSRWLVA